MLKQSMKHKKGQQGFTLLEILVVVAIMGFLVAMVAPRFAGITDGTIDVVCDTNQQRMVQVLSAFNETSGSLPGGMVNLVDSNTAATPAVYQRPTHTGELEFPDEGQATLFESFYDRNLFQVHYLNTAEVSDLRALGIGSVHNLNAYNYDGLDSIAYPFTEIADTSEALQRVAVGAGLGVLMIGMGASDTAAVLAGPAVVTTAGVLGDGTDPNYGGWGNPEWLGRIILGVGPDSQLVRDGMITAAGLCPGGVNNEQVYWNNYNVVVPRLAATTERFPAGAQTDLVGKSLGGAHRAFNLTEAQESFQFLTQCPEGHRWPTPDEFSAWAIYAGLDIDETDSTATGALATVEVTEY